MKDKHFKEAFEYKGLSHLSNEELEERWGMVIASVDKSFFFQVLNPVCCRRETQILAVKTVLELENQSGDNDLCPSEEENS
jgi:hypothetical protein